MYAYCPKCEKNALSLGLKLMKAKGLNTTELNCVVYTCKSCNTILGVQTDPLAVMNDTVSRVKKLLGR